MDSREHGAAAAAPRRRRSRSDSTEAYATVELIERPAERDCTVQHGLHKDTIVSLFPVGKFFTDGELPQRKHQFLRELQSRVRTISNRRQESGSRSSTSLSTSPMGGGDVVLPIGVSSLPEAWLVCEDLAEKTRPLDDWMQLTSLATDWDICDAVDVACDLVTALVSLHTQGLVHGHITPLSVVVERTRRHCKVRTCTVHAFCF